MISILAYVGDALSVLSLSIMFSLSLAVSRAAPETGRKVWILPALAGSLFALWHLSLARPR